MKRLIFHVEAEQELAEASTYFSTIDPELGVRFSLEIERLVENVCRDPRLFPFFDKPIQRHFSTVFPYAILYFESADYVFVIAVMHMSRQPGYWRDRLRTGGAR